ncbi:hypothetical protein GGR56DRAFT_658960 [Xylariaceae sp. FL0804]|nr:hypothetical protein GGR56DRAFT_658960 [Xylariaceae sp. FL0804]
MRTSVGRYGSGTAAPRDLAVPAVPPLRARRGGTVSFSSRLGPETGTWFLDQSLCPGGRGGGGVLEAGEEDRISARNQPVGTPRSYRLPTVSRSLGVLTSAPELSIASEYWAARRMGWRPKRGHPFPPGPLSFITVPNSRDSQIWRGQDAGSRGSLSAGSSPDSLRFCISVMCIYNPHPLPSPPAREIGRIRDTEGPALGQCQGPAAAAACSSAFP